MNNEQILKKAIEKAEKNGFNFGNWVMNHVGDKYPKIKEADTLSAIVWLNLDWIIYSHSFAKAYFGEEIRTYRDSTNKFKWQYNLQQMVLEKEPLKYIARFLENESNNSKN